MTSNHVSLSSNSIARVLGAVAFLLILASVGGQLAAYVTGHDSVYGLVRLFYVDAEQNIPTFFSTSLLLCASLLLAVITALERNRRASHVSHWAIPSFGFLLMAADEAVSFHERLSAPTRKLLGGGVRPPMGLMNEARIREDFDEIAVLSGMHGGGDARYDGCGLGRLAASLTAPRRTVLGIDLSPEMVARARVLGCASENLTFECGNFLEMDFPKTGFDCVISVAPLHHMPVEAAVHRMIQLVRPGGTLVIHDLRSDSGVLNRAGSILAGVANCVERFFRTGRLFQERALREAWARHEAFETYLSMSQSWKP